MGEHRLLGISGSLRGNATNRKLIAEAFRLYGSASTQVADLNLPLYDGDLESKHGVPEEVQRLASQIAEADAVIISSPEYNKAIPGVLKNALDWISRTKGGPWAGKPVAVMSASAGRTGGETGQYTIRHALGPFRPRLVLGPAVMIADGSNAFDEAGKLLSERYIKTLTDYMAALRAEVERGR